MHLRDVLTISKARLFAPSGSGRQIQSLLDREVLSAFGSDLMSDVLCYDVSHGLLITGLINPQVVRTAEMADIAAILMVRGKVPQPATIELAEQVGIPILGTTLIMFEACGRLYQAGLVASSEYSRSVQAERQVEEDCWGNNE